MKTHHKAIYKPDSMSTDEFIVIVADREAAEKWVAGGELRFRKRKGTGKWPVVIVTPSPFTNPNFFPLLSVPLIEIVDSFEVFHTGQGAQGLLARPSKQQLETVFETTNEDAIVEIVLSKGRLESSDGPLKLGNKNDQRAGTNQISAGGKAGQHGGR
ncbi:hypothetical protein JCM1841_006755 [Sporobolomyces salmonicolor]